MAKPEKIRYSGAAIMADGAQLKRVQSFDASIDIGQEQVLELANSGIVQFIDQTPNVSISIDTNLYGSTDNAALLTGKSIHKTRRSNSYMGRKGYYNHIMTTANGFTVTETDFLNSYCNLAIPILEGTTSIARTMVIPRAAITGYSLNFDVGGLATENFTLQAADKYWYMNYWKDVRVLKLTDWHIASSASPTVNNRIPHLTGTGQAFVHLGTVMGCAGRNATGGAGTGYQLSTVVALIVNDKVYRSTGLATGVGDGPYYFSTGHSITTGASNPGSGGFIRIGKKGNLPTGVSTPYAVAGDDVWMIFQPIQSQTWDGRTPAAPYGSADPGYALVSTSGSYGGVSKGFIDAFLYNTDGPSGASPAYKTSTTAGRTLRLQTVSIDISLSSEALDELGTFQSYGVLRNPPVPVNVTVTANDSDIEMFARACASAAGIIGSGTNILSTQNFSKANQLRIDVYKDKQKQIKLETIIIDSMSVAGDSYNVAVGGNAAQEITFLADNIRLQGLAVAV